MDTVIDTNIFVHAKDLHREYGMNCFMFLSNFMQRNDNMALDHDNRIMQEYQDNISGKDIFFQMFFVEMHRQKRFIYGDSKINKRQKDRLVQLGFHEPEDHIFVGVALNTGKTIITDDSDYGANGEIDKQKVYEYMIKELNLNILNSKQAKERYFLPDNI